MLNLPNASNAFAEQKKIVDYLLAFDHPEGTGKAAFFTHFGFSRDDWELLARTLVWHARSSQVSSISESKHGTKYRIDGPLPCPNGRSPSIRAVWIIDACADAPRLVTAYPLS